MLKTLQLFCIFALFLMFSLFLKAKSGSAQSADSATPLSSLNKYPFAITYSNTAPLQLLKRYQLLVFDSDSHPALEDLLNSERVILGYLSLGEVNSSRAYFAEVKQQGILLEENKNWPGSFMVDLRRKEWQKRVTKKLVPAILEQGFHGIFIDTLDNAGHLERTDPIKYKGMQQAAVDLVRSIREKYPNCQIMLNRGYDLLDQIAPYISAVLGESVYSTYDFSNKQYKFVEINLYQKQSEILNRAKSRNTTLSVYTLDYWDPADATGRAKIYTEQRENGFLPYVATIELDRIIEE